MSPDVSPDVSGEESAAGRVGAVYRMIVSGRVQGVYFRAYTANYATALGIVGYARNLPDGTVEILAGGSVGALETLVAHVRRGPPQADVRELTLEGLAPEAVAGYEGFSRR